MSISENKIYSKMNCNSSINSLIIQSVIAIELKDFKKIKTILPHAQKLWFKIFSLRTVNPYTNLRFILIEFRSISFLQLVINVF